MFTNHGKENTMSHFIGVGHKLYRVEDDGKVYGADGVELDPITYEPRQNNGDIVLPQEPSVIKNPRGNPNWIKKDK